MADTPESTTENHQFQKFADDQNWEHRTDFDALDTKVEVRDTEANLSNYTPQNGAKFYSTDTGVVYTGDGNSWSELQPDIVFSALNQNRVVDTSGGVYGELTGTNDAQVVIDAISNRASGSGVVIPDPGFALDWEQQVDLPAAEARFRLRTVGTPTLSIPSGFADDHAIRKPASGAANDNLVGYETGPMQFDDPNQLLDPALSLIDIKAARVEEPSGNCPLVEIIGENTTSNQNVIYKPFIKGGELDGNRKPGISLLEGGSGDAADQNWVIAPFFNDDVTFLHTAYRDEGRQNNWLYIRAEGASTIMEMAGDDYKVISGGWDRAGSYNATVAEEVDSEGGIIHLQRASNYPALELHAPSTRVITRADHPTEQDPVGRPVDLFDPLSRLTPATSLGALHMQDASSGGTIVKTRSINDHVRLGLNAGTTTGNYAQLDMGEDAFKQSSYPKLSMGLLPATTDGSGQQVIRMGLFESASNRVELIYDPQNDLGGHTNANWYAEVENGTASDSTDTGVSAGTGSGVGDVLSINVVEDPGAGTESYVFSVNGTARTEVATGGNNIAQATWRLKIRTLDGGDQSMEVEARDGMRFYRV